MKEGPSSKTSMKSIKIMLTEEEYQKIAAEAERMKYSLRQYVKMKALDDDAGVEQRSRQIMQLMPKFYNYVDDVEDLHTKKQLMKIGGQICQFLR